MKKSALTLLIVILMSLAAADTCDQKIQRMVGMTLVLENSTAETKPAIQSAPVSIECNISSFETLNETGWKVADSFVAKGKQSATPEELATALREQGWKERMWVVEYPDQYVKVSFPGETPYVTHLVAGETLVTIATQKTDVNHGEEVVKLMNLDYTEDTEGYIAVEPNNAWGHLPTLEKVNLIDPIKITSIEEFA